MGAEAHGLPSHAVAFTVLSSRRGAPPADNGGNRDWQVWKTWHGLGEMKGSWPPAGTRNGTRAMMEGPPQSGARTHGARSVGQAHASFCCLGLGVGDSRRHGWYPCPDVGTPQIAGSREFRSRGRGAGQGTDQWEMTR